MHFMSQRLCNCANVIPWSVLVGHMRVSYFFFFFFFFRLLIFMILSISGKPVESKRSNRRFSSSIGLGHMANTQPMLREPSRGPSPETPLPFPFSLPNPIPLSHS
ncbi:hypothetical protein V8C35DRAFT_187387 [Trichoderma chlorosporum]